MLPKKMHVGQCLIEKAALLLPTLLTAARLYMGSHRLGLVCTHMLPKKMHVGQCLIEKAAHGP